MVDKSSLIQDSTGLEVKDYDRAVRESYIMEDLKAVRNVKPSFNYGRGVGLAHSALSTVVTRGKEPWTLRNGYTCASKTKKKAECEPIEYAKPMES